MTMNVGGDVTAEDPPAEVLAALTLDEAQELMLLLSVVLEDGETDKEFADNLLSHLAPRVPSLASAGGMGS
ncbi:hypothetical protein ACWCOW_37595 [Streptomyces sp. NPDC001939]